MSIYLIFRELATKSCKVFFILAAVIGFVISVNAQDVIVTKEGQKINAKITEINENDIRYKNFDNIDGPSYFMKKTEIATIVYENGTVDVFNNQTSTTTLQVNPNNTPQDNLKREFDRIGTYDDAMLEFFRRNNFTEYHNRFKSACKMRSNGTALLGAGIGLTGVGVLFIILEATDVIWPDDWSWYSSWVCIGVGHILTVASIPVSATAGVRKRAIKNEFAKEKFGVEGYTYQPTLNFGFTGNGFSVILKF